MIPREIKREMAALRARIAQLERAITKLPVRVAQGGGGSLQVKRFALWTTTPVGADYIIVDDGSGNQLKIAKPYLLRQTPFDGNTLDGLTYSYTDGTERNVDDGTDNENQIIVPSYTIKTNGVIYAAKGISGGTGVTVDDEDLTWLDINVDARAWARKQS